MYVCMYIYMEELHGWFNVEFSWLNEMLLCIVLHSSPAGGNQNAIRQGCMVLLQGMPASQARGSTRGTQLTLRIGAYEFLFRMYVCMYVCMYDCDCMHVCMYVCMYAFMYVSMFVCMYCVCLPVCLLVFVLKYRFIQLRGWVMWTYRINTISITYNTCSEENVSHRSHLSSVYVIVYVCTMYVCVCNVCTICNVCMYACMYSMYECTICNVCYVCYVCMYCMYMYACICNVSQIKQESLREMNVNSCRSNIVLRHAYMQPYTSTSKYVRPHAHPHAHLHAHPYAHRHAFTSTSIHACANTCIRKQGTTLNRELCMHYIHTYIMYIHYVHTFIHYVHYIHTYIHYVHTYMYIHTVHTYIMYIHTDMCKDNGMSGSLSDPACKYVMLMVLHFCARPHLPFSHRMYVCLYYCIVYIP